MELSCELQEIVYSIVVVMFAADTCSLGAFACDGKTVTGLPALHFMCTAHLSWHCYVTHFTWHLASGLLADGFTVSTSQPGNFFVQCRACVCHVAMELCED